MTINKDGLVLFLLLVQCEYQSYVNALYTDFSGCAMAVISFFFLGDEKIYLYGSITGFALYSVFFVSQAIVNDQLYTDPNPVNRAATSVPVLVVIIISAMNAVVLAMMIYFTVKAKEGPGINPKKVRDSRIHSTLHMIDGPLTNVLWIPC